MKIVIYLLICIALNLSQGLEPLFGSGSDLSDEEERIFAVTANKLLDLSARSTKRSKIVASVTKQALPASPTQKLNTEHTGVSLFEEILPQEIKAHIFSFLSSNKELLNIQNVCTSWRQPVHITLANREITLSSKMLIAFLQGSS